MAGVINPTSVMWIVVRQDLLVFVRDIWCDVLQKTS